MSKWVDRITTHPALSKLRKISDSAASARPGASPEQEDALDRLRAVADFATAVISATDPVLVPIQALGNLVGPAQEIEAQLANYRSNPTSAQLDTANTQADILLVHLGALRPIALPEDSAAIRTASQTLRKSVSQLKHGVEEERRELSAGLASVRKQTDDAKADIATQKARLDTAIATFQEQFSKAEDERRSAFASFQSAREENASASAQAHRDLQAKLTDEAAQALEAIRREADSVLGETVAALEEKGEALVGEIEGHEKRARELVFLTANTTTVGSYKQVADKQRVEGLVWRIIAALAFAGLIVFGIWAFVHASAPEAKATWLSVSGRVFAALTFGLLGAFAAREASRFALGEERNRRTELALAAIGPYLQGLPDDLQYEVRREVARGVFVVSERSAERTQPAQAPSETALPGERQMEVVGKVLETLQRLIERIK